VPGVGGHFSVGVDSATHLDYVEYGAAKSPA
jgi:hypothetical protein